MFVANLVAPRATSLSPGCLIRNSANKDGRRVYFSELDFNLVVIHTIAEDNMWRLDFGKNFWIEDFQVGAIQSAANLVVIVVEDPCKTFTRQAGDEEILCSNVRGVDKILGPVSAERGCEEGRVGLDVSVPARKDVEVGRVERWRLGRGWPGTLLFADIKKGMDSSEVVFFNHVKAALLEQPVNVLLSQQDCVLKVEGRVIMFQKLVEIRGGKYVELTRLQKRPDNVKKFARVVHVLERVRMHNHVNVARQLLDVLNVRADDAQVWD